MKLWLRVPLLVVLLILLGVGFFACNPDPTQLSDEDAIKFTLLANEDDLFDIQTFFNLDEIDQAMISSVNLDLEDPMGDGGDIVSPTFGLFHGFKRKVPRTFSLNVEDGIHFVNITETEAIVDICYPVRQGSFINRIVSNEDTDQTEPVYIRTHKDFFAQGAVRCHLQKTEQRGWIITGMSPTQIYSTNFRGTYRPPLLIETVEIQIAKALTGETYQVNLQVNIPVNPEDPYSYTVSYYYRDADGNPQTQEQSYFDLDTQSHNPLMQLTTHDKIWVYAKVQNNTPCSLNEASCISTGGPHNSTSEKAWYRSNTAVFLHTNGLVLRVSDDFNNPNDNPEKELSKSRFQMRNLIMKLIHRDDIALPPAPSGGWELLDAEIVGISELDAFRYRLRDYLYIEAIDSNTLTSYLDTNDLIQSGIAIPILVRFLQNP